MTRNGLRTLTLAFLLAATAAGGTLAVPPVAAADSCKDNANLNGDMGCSFSCQEGETVGVTVQASDSAWGSAECNGASAGCNNYFGGCADAGADTASSDGEGQCDGHGPSDSSITCISGDGGYAYLLQLLGDGEDCEEVESAALAAGASSIQRLVVGADGVPATVFAWNVKTGCLPELPSEEPDLPTAYEVLVFIRDLIARPLG